MRRNKKTVITAAAGCMLLAWLSFCLVVPRNAEAAVGSRIKDAKGQGFISLAQRWNNKINKINNQKYASGKEVVGYYTKDWETDTQSDNSLKINSDKITGVATFSYKVGLSGEITGETPKSALDTALDTGIETLALVHNLTSSGFNRQLIHSILTNPILRTNTVSNIYKVLVKDEFDGVHIDFENIPPGDRQEFNEFIDELKAKLEPDGFKVTIALPAKTVDNPSDEWSGAFDYKHISESVDKVMLMTYDEHYFGGSAGPVASKPWVEKVVNYSLSVIPKEKILLGIGNYGYDWFVSGGGYKSVPSKNAVAIARNYGAEIKWDDSNQTPYFYYWQNYQNHVVWFESKESAAFKLDLVNKYGLQGIALWKLGFEAPGFWQMVAGKLN